MFARLMIPTSLPSRMTGTRLTRFTSSNAATSPRSEYLLTRRFIAIRRGWHLRLFWYAQVRVADPSTALARDFVAGRDVDDEDRQVGQFRAERRCQIIAAAFDQQNVGVTLICSKHTVARQSRSRVLSTSTRRSCHSRLYLAHEAFHRVDQLLDVAVAMEIDLESLDTRRFSVAQQVGSNLGGRTVPG
jgi:hypothetical protein